jgi:branched-chain amino acid transport system permease protein
VKKAGIAVAVVAGLWIANQLFIGALVPGFRMGPYFLQVVCLAGINIILAVSLNLINGFTGQFSIGHAGFMAIGAYASAFVTVTFGDRIRAALPFLPEGGRNGALLLLSLFVGALLAAIAGFLVGVPSLRLRGDYLAIVTLGFGEIIRAVIVSITRSAAREIHRDRLANFF